MSNEQTAIAPEAIRYHRRSKMLEVAFPGETHELTAEYLRVYSPSAEVRGHGAGERVLQTGKKHVAITDIEPIGNYAVRLQFDDGHDTGLYSWEHLLDLGRNRDRYWQDYLRELKTANASRLPNIASMGIGHWQPVEDP